MNDIHVSALPRFLNLTELNLTANKSLTDHAITIVSTLFALSEVIFFVHLLIRPFFFLLNLTSKIAGGCPNLRTLRLEFCSRLTGRTLPELKALPRLRVIFLYQSLRGVDDMEAGVLYRRNRAAFCARLIAEVRPQLKFYFMK